MKKGEAQFRFGALGVQKGAKIRILGFIFGGEGIQRHFKSLKRQSFFSAFGVHFGVRKGDKKSAFWRLLRSLGLPLAVLWALGVSFGQFRRSVGRFGGPMGVVWGSGGAHLGAFWLYFGVQRDPKIVPKSIQK